MRSKDVKSADEERPVDVENTVDEDAVAVVWNSDDEDAVVESPTDDSISEEGGNTADTTKRQSKGDDSLAEEEDPEIPSATLSKDNGERRSAWRHFVTDELPQISFREILGGDLLVRNGLRNNIGFIVFLVVLGVAYITNRYMAQQEIIEIEKLHKELEKQKNFTLTQSAQLTMHSRQSYLDRRIRETGDSLVTSSNEPPFIIRVK